MHAPIDNSGGASSQAAFDPQSGNLLERLVFNHRLVLLIACALLTAVFAFQLRGLGMGASFDKMLPHDHPYIKNYLENRASCAAWATRCAWWSKPTAATSSTPSTWPGSRRSMTRSSSCPASTGRG
jgi:hypothetical protein